MKKLTLTLIMIALSGSSLFGVHGQPGPIINGVRHPQSSGTTAFMDPKLSDCLQKKKTGSMTPEKAQEAYQECVEEGKSEGDAFVGGVTAYDDPNLQECLERKGKRTEDTLRECNKEFYGIVVK